MKEITEAVLYEVSLVAEAANPHCVIEVAE